MAENTDAEKQTDAEPEAAAVKAAEKADDKASGLGLFLWIVLAGAVIIFAAAGFIGGRMLGGSRSSEPEEATADKQTAELAELQVENPGKGAKVWYYDLDPVVANLDEPGVTRYVRATLTLAISPEADTGKTTAYLNEKKPLLTNWLTIYLASLRLEDIRGDKNLRRIQSEVLDTFNEKVFPDAKPRIEKVLFKEFAIQ